LDSIISKIKETKKPALIYLDEVEKIIHTNMVDYSGEGDRINNILLQNIENIIKSDLDIVVVCGISKKSNLDERFLNYEYLTEQFYFEKLTNQEREDVFTMYIQNAEKQVNKKMFAIDVKEIAQKSE
jgi:SpoVK/Ycf46/Vps4 family AAA+-type ATPase